MTNHLFSEAGFGLGLRSDHYQDILNQPTLIDWFEIISEDFMTEDGSHTPYLDDIKEKYPIAMHGVSLSIGSCDPLNIDYLKKLKQLIHRINPLWVSDHLCWTGINGVNIHDLMPLPFTKACLSHVVNRIKAVQDYLNRPILLENVSSYVSYHDSEMTEWEFLSEVALQSDSYILLDVNNVYVSAFNHGFDPNHYLNYLPKDRVKQFHLAGHDHCGTHIIDTHDHPIVSDVWQLYKTAVACFPKAATLIERDGNIPPLAELIKELEYAKSIHSNIVAEQTV